VIARTAQNRYSIEGEINREYAADDQIADNLLGYMKYDHFLIQKSYSSSRLTWG
jgi:hypothetical protein